MYVMIMFVLECQFFLFSRIPPIISPITATEFVKSSRRFIVIIVGAKKKTRKEMRYNNNNIIIYNIIEQLYTSSSHHRHIIILSYSAERCMSSLRYML